MLNRRQPRSFRQKLREALWPSMGFKRLMVYYKHRMGRLPGTPYYIAGGFATGVAISFTPFVGLHIMLGAAVIWAIRTSFLAMVLGTLFAGNPWILPLILLGSYNLGHYMMGREMPVQPVEFSFGELTHHPIDLFLPTLLGSLPLALLFWLLSYYLSRRVIVQYRAARLQRILEKHNG